MTDDPSTLAPPCDFLEWDSTFFGKRIGSIRAHTLSSTDMHDVLAWSAEMAIDCVYLLANTDDPPTIRMAETHGFYFQSVKTTLERSLADLSGLDLPAFDGLVLRPGTADDLDVLRTVARNAYTWTRFYNDPCFAEGKSAEMYDIWLTKSVQGSMADYVVVAELNGEAVGYMTCRLPHGTSREGTIGLVGVNEAHRGAKIGQRTITQALHWLAEQGMTTVSLVTQGNNVAVIRFYERLGFTTRSVQFWYHKWFNDCDTD